MTAEKLRIGIIGCGGIAFGKHLPSLAKLDSVEIIAFSDNFIENAEKAAKQYGKEGASVYSDYKELCDRKDIDVVHVCTPNKSHSEISIYALESGKHVMCEKPMAKTSEEARKMMETAKRTGKKFTIGYQNRYRVESRYLKAVCERGDLGEIYFAKAHALRRRGVPTWGVFLNENEQGGGSLIDIGTHALDLTLWMMNNYKVKYVVGNTYHKLGNIRNAANAWGPWDPEKFTVEDSAFGFITMQNGATIILESSWALNILETGEAKTTICGTLGGADMMKDLRINGEEFGKLFVKNLNLDDNGVDFYNSKKDGASDLEMKLWIEECILKDKDPVVKPEEALVVTEILEAIYESGKTGKPVYF